MTSTSINDLTIHVINSGNRTQTNMLIWHSPFFLQLMLSRHSGHCFRLDLSHHCSLSDKEYFPRIIVWNFVNTRVHVHLGVDTEFPYRLFFLSGIKMTGGSKTLPLIFVSFRTVPRIDCQLLAGERPPKNARTDHEPVQKLHFSNVGI